MLGKLLSIEWKEAKPVVLAQDLGNGDGVTRLDDGSFLVSEWPSRLFHVTPGKEPTTQTLIDAREQKPTSTTSCASATCCWCRTGNRAR